MLFDPSSNQLPKRKDLPKVDGAPQGAAWFWGAEDSIGRLNLLTPARTLEAAKLIKTGEVVCLNWQANLPDPPLFSRQKFEWKIDQRSARGFDDIVCTNTQSGSQWDGFRHCGYELEEGVIFYNGVKSEEFATSPKAGIGAWAQHGIAGRAVFIDYWSYKQKEYNPNTTHRITVKEIKDCASKNGIEFQYGDILVFRSGFIDTYNGLPTAERERLASLKSKECTFVGLEQSGEMLAFLHDSYFSAVVSDTPAFEAWPPQGRGLHTHALALWGLPIGELWDLERLSELCHAKKQYAFFLTSAPTNLPGAIGSSPNAQAIF